MFKIPKFSPAPHYQGDESIPKIMTGVIYALIPAILMSVIFFGIGSLKAIAIAVASCLFFEWVIQKYIAKVPVTIRDRSATVTGILLALCLPFGIPSWIIVLGSLIAIGGAKLAFGGLGKNLFNPVLVGWLFLRISFPVQMTTWSPNVITSDAFTGATPLVLINEGIKSGKTLAQLTGDLQLPGYFDLFWGNVSGSLGEISALALLIGGLYLLLKKIITWHIPTAILTTVLVLQGLLWIVAPGRFMDPVFHLITGGIVFGAIFMATDPTTSPATPYGQIIYGVGIGIITLLIRNFGPYPEGVAIAILVMNGITPLINKTEFGFTRLLG